MLIENANFGLKTPDRAAVNITGENEGMGDGDRSGFGADQSGGGPAGWIADPHDQEPYLVEARRLYHGATRLVVRPASTAEVASVVRICAEADLAIVPQGGNTGLVGGGFRPRIATTSCSRSAG